VRVNHLNIKWLEDFICLAVLGSFTRAADRRCATQSAFSRRIQSLEIWIGEPLVDRGASPVRLTPAGEAFLPVAKQTVQRLGQGRRNARRHAETERAAVCFTATQVTARVHFFSLLRNLEAAIGPVQTDLEIADGDQTRGHLLSGRAHIAVRHAHAEDAMRRDAAFDHCVVGRDTLAPVVAPAALAQGDPPRLDYPSGSSLGAAVTSADRTMTPLQERQAAAPIETTILRSMVREGYGYGWLPLNDVAEDLAQGRLVRAPVAAGEIHLDILAFRLRDPLPPRAEAVWSSLGATAAALALEEKLDV